jgi:hypothetical protein
VVIPFVITYIYRVWEHIVSLIGVVSRLLESQTAMVSFYLMEQITSNAVVQVQGLITDSTFCPSSFVIICCLLCHSLSLPLRIIFSIASSSHSHF